MRGSLTGKIRELLWKNRKMKKSELCEITGKSWSYLRRLVDEMKSRGEVDFDRENIWLIKKIEKDADKIWRAMKIMGVFMPADIARLTDVKSKIVVNYICKFVKAGAVVKAGKKGKNCFYRIVKDKRPDLR